MNEGHGVSVVGDSRIGKSSLLWTFALAVEKTGRTFRPLDGQGPEGASAASFVTHVLGHTSPGTTEAAADALAAWAQSEPEGLAPVLLIDELERMIRDIDPRFFERMRYLMTHNRVVLITASRKPVDLLYEEIGRTSPFHNLLRPLLLGLVAPSTAEEIADLGAKSLDREDRELLQVWAGRHPCHLQLFGHYLVEARQLGESRARALEEYYVAASERLNENWRRLEERDQRDLRAAVSGRSATRRSLRSRGWVTEEGRPFGEILSTWIREES